MAKEKSNSDYIRERIDKNLAVLKSKRDRENSRVEALRIFQSEYITDLIQYDDLKGDLEPIKLDIKEMKTWILPDDYRIRAKTYSHGKEFWVHLGKRIGYKSKTDEQFKSYKPLKDRAKRELKNVIERYYNKHIISKRVNIQTRLNKKYKNDSVRPVVKDTRYFSEKTRYDLPIIKVKIKKLIENPDDFTPTQFRVELKRLINMIERDMLRLDSEVEKAKLKIRDIEIDIQDNLSTPIKEVEKTERDL
jgi:hypothetical protein